VTSAGPDGRPSASLEECLLAAWPGPFGWLLVAEPLSAAEIGQLAEELAQREQYATGDSDRFPRRATAARRLSLRHGEMRKGVSSGLWRIWLLAGGADAEAAARVAGLVCASADLSGLPTRCTLRRDGGIGGSSPRRGGPRGMVAGGNTGRGRSLPPAATRWRPIPFLREQRAGRRAVLAARARDAGNPAAAAARFRRDPGDRGRTARRSPSARSWTGTGARTGPLTLPLDSLKPARVRQRRDRIGEIADRAGATARPPPRPGYRGWWWSRPRPSTG
jgi:hypothetical protein